MTCQGDETIACRDVVVLKGTAETDREVGAAETCEHTTQQHGLGLGRNDLDPDGVGSIRMLPHRTDSETPLCAIDQEPHQRHRDQRDEGQRTLREQDGPDEWNV